jgi:hypothetical protein
MPRNSRVPDEGPLHHAEDPGGTPAGATEPGTAFRRAPWVEPAVQELPRLTDLTLVTIDGGSIGGGFSGGSTVF